MTDGVLKLGYTSVIFVDLEVKVDGTYNSGQWQTPNPPNLAAKPNIYSVSRKAAGKNSSCRKTARKMDSVAAIIFQY